VTIKFVRKNDYRDQLEIRGFPIDEERYGKLVEKQYKREEERVKVKDDKWADCKQTKLKFR
jgi:hypothetical protein